MSNDCSQCDIGSVCKMGLCVQQPGSVKTGDRCNDDNNCESMKCEPLPLNICEKYNLPYQPKVCTTQSTHITSVNDFSQ